MCVCIGHDIIILQEAMQPENKYRRYKAMALSNISGWDENTASSACGASDKPAACGSACGAGDKPAEKPAACGSACGAGDKPEEKPAARGSACGAGDK